MPNKNDRFDVQQQVKRVLEVTNPVNMVVRSVEAGVLRDGGSLPIMARKQRLEGTQGSGQMGFIAPDEVGKGGSTEEHYIQMKGILLVVEGGEMFTLDIDRRTR